MTTTTVQAPNVSAWKGGLLLLRASWSTLKLDKKLLLLPLYSFIASLLITFIAGVIVWASGSHTQLLAMLQSSEQSLSWRWIVPIGLFYFLHMAIANFFTVALISCVFDRFRNRTSSIRYGLAQARSKIASITLFTLMSSTIGTLLQLIENNIRIPLLAKLLAWTADIAWHVVTVFAMPVIAASDKPLNPVGTIKKSAAVFKKVWKVDFTGGLSMGLIFAAAMIPMFLLTFLVFIGSVELGLKLYVTIPLIIALWMPLIILSATLNGIFSAALYHYAETGESPEKFDKTLLQAAFVPKKKWFV